MSSKALRQRNLTVPLVPTMLNRVSVLGVVGLRCRVGLYIESQSDSETDPLEFVVDSGASYTLMSLTLAIARGIAVPPSESEVEIHLRTATGLQSLRVRPGRIRGWWGAGRNGYPFDWPILFRVDAPSVPSILGLGGVVKTCRWQFDGTYSAESPHGSLTLDDIR